jgi:hypothetical protein
MRSPTVLLLLAAAGCGTAAIEEAPEPPPDVVEEAPPPLGPPPEVTLAVAVEDGRVAPRIENRGAEAVALRPALGLQRRTGHGWDPVTDDARLRYDCDTAPPGACLSLVPGATFLPPPVGRDAQCGETTPLEPGTYRYTVESCEGHALASAEVVIE